MRSQCSKLSSRWLGLWTLFGLLILAASSLAQTGHFTRLQVLLPGETAAPGTLSGKTGIPIIQTAGVPFSVDIRACDNDWNTVSSVSDLVEWSTDDVTSDPPTTGHLNAGRLTVMVTLNQVGIFAISGRDLSDPNISGSISANVVTVALAEFKFARINREGHTAGLPMFVELSAVDPFGNPAQGYSGPVNLQQLTSFGQGRISPETVTMDQGVWSGYVTLYRADETNVNFGNVSIYATLPEDVSINGASNPFLVHPGALKRIQLVLPGQTPLPGSVFGVTGSPATQGATQSFTVDLFATDNFWNPLSCEDRVRITTSDMGVGTALVTTLVDGRSQAMMQLVTIGNQTLTATDLSDGDVSSMTSPPITVIAAFADHFEFDALPAAILAGAENLVSIRAVDTDGNIVPEFSGDTMLTASTGPGTISVEAVTFTEGVWSGIVKFYGAGDAVQLTCSDYSTPTHEGTSTATHVLPGPYVAIQVILPNQIARSGNDDGFEGQPSHQEAGREFSIHIRAVDEFFNCVAGINNPVEINSEDPNIIVPEHVSLVDGRVCIPVTVHVAGSQVISATDAAIQNIDTLSSSAFTVLPGPYARLLVVAPGESVQAIATGGRTGTPIDQSISNVFTVTALATDQWYNHVADVDDEVHLTSTDPEAELAEDTVLENGEAALDVRLATGGYQLITLTSTRNPVITPSTTQVRAISSGLHFEAGIAQNLITAGMPFTLHVRIVNDAGSIVQEFNSAVQVTAYNANTLAAGNGTLAATSFQLLQGQRAIALSYTCAEPIILEISDSVSGATGLTGVLDVRAAAPTVITLASEPNWVRANSTAVIAARITDVYDNPVANQTVTFASAAGDAGWMTSHNGKANDTAMIGMTDETGIARMDYHSPRHAQVARVIASSGELSTDFELETALIDPTAAGGLLTNYPNPFHPNETATTIAYMLDDDASVRMRIYTVSGGLVLDQRFASGVMGGATGLNEIQWDGRNGDGEPVASGGYIVYVEAEGTGATQHVMRRKIGVVW